MKLPVDYEVLSPSERRGVREEYVKIQNGLCFYCGEPLSGEPRKDVAEKSVRASLFPLNFFKWPIHLQHNHDTGMTEGAVHCYCNAVLWQYEGR